MGLLGWIIDWCLQDTEEDLYSQYRTDVIDCHPFKGSPPITFEEFKKMISKKYNDDKYRVDETIVHISEPHFEYSTPPHEDSIIG